MRAEFLHRRLYYRSSRCKVHSLLDGHSVSFDIKTSVAVIDD